MTIHTANDEETRAAFEQCKANGWRVLVLARGKGSNSAWVLTVDAPDPLLELPPQPVANEKPVGSFRGKETGGSRMSHKV